MEHSQDQICQALILQHQYFSYLGQIELDEANKNFLYFLLKKIPDCFRSIVITAMEINDEPWEPIDATVNKKSPFD